MGYIAPIVYNQSVQYQDRIRNPDVKRTVFKVNALDRSSRYERQYESLSDHFSHIERFRLSHHFGQFIDKRV